MRRRAAFRAAGAPAKRFGLLLPLNILLLLCILGPVSPVSAGFEILPLDETPGPHLPLGLPSPFSVQAGEAGEGLAAGFLHLRPFGLEVARFDAVGVGWSPSGLSLSSYAARLGTKGYQEWEVGLRAVHRWGLGLHLRMLRTLPSPELERDWGVRPVPAWTAAPVWRISIGTKVSCALAWRDLVSDGNARLLGLHPSPALRLNLDLGAGWGLVCAGGWSSISPGKVRSRVALTWSLGEAHGLGLEWARGSGSSWLWTGAAGVRAQVWSCRDQGALPATTGLCLSLSNSRKAADPDPGLPTAGCGIDSTGAARFPGAPTGGCGIDSTLTEAIPEGSASGVGSPPRSASLEEPFPDWLDWVGDGLLLDGAPLMVLDEADSLGEWTDSLEVGMGSPPARHPAWRIRAPRQTRPGGSPLPTAQGEAPGNGPIRLPLSRLDLIPGIGRSAADSLAFLLGSGGRLPALEALPSGLRRPLLEAAPYLVPDFPPSASPEASWSRPRKTSLQIQDTRRRSSTGRWSETQRIDGSWEGEPARVRLALRRYRGTRPASGSGWIILEGNDWRAALGRGGAPLRWGLGLLGRSRVVSLSRQSPAVSGRPAAAAGPGGQSERPEAPDRRSRPGPLLSPTLSGSADFLALSRGMGEGFQGALSVSWAGQDPARGLAASSLSAAGARLQGTLERSRGPWHLGLLGERWEGTDAAGLHAARVHGTGLLQAECLLREGEGLLGALRWSAAVDLKRGAGLWWDLTARHPLRIPSSGPGAARLGQQGFRPLRSVRIGGSRRGSGFGADLTWREPPVASPGSRGTSQSWSLRGWALPEGLGYWRIDARGHSSSSTCSPPEEDPLAGAPCSGARTVRLRLVMETDPDRGSGANGSWGLECGSELENRRTCGGLARQETGWWAGGYRRASARFFRSFSASGSIGLLHVDPGSAPSLQLSPSWTGGPRRTMRGRGLWLGLSLALGSTRLSWRAGGVIPVAVEKAVRGEEGGGLETRVTLRLDTGRGNLPPTNRPRL